MLYPDYATVSVMLIQENYPLREHNSFGIYAYAKRFAEIREKEALPELFSHSPELLEPHLVLGGGSNVLFTNDFDGTVLKIDLRGKQVIGSRNGQNLLWVAAGEPWDDLVAFCVEQEYGGLENLSLIPGQAGSSPIQNIGAYGVELKDHFYSLEAFDKQSGQFVNFSRDDCQFGYRDSFFKRKGKDRYIIVSVVFSLNTSHQIKTDYGTIQDELQSMGVRDAGIAEVREAVCQIRRRKLPDPDILGNAGSFFKNPVISTKTFERLQKAFPDIVSFPVRNGVKLAAGWLIEKAGWKGYREGDAAVHDKQALVLVNHGNATGEDILELGNKIQQSIYNLYGIKLEPEVNII